MMALWVLLSLLIATSHSQTPNDPPPPSENQTVFSQVMMGTPIVWGDIWDMELKWLSGGFGFDNIIMFPFNNSTDNTDQQIALGNAIVQNEAGFLGDSLPLQCASGEPADNVQTSAAYTSGATAFTFGLEPVNPGFPINLWQFDQTFLDGTPLCFSWPVLGDTVDLTDILVTLNTGETFHPDGISTIPNNEMNEKTCLVIFMDLGNRIIPNGENDCTSRAEANNTADSCAFYPSLFEIVDDLYFVGPPENATIEDGPWGQDEVQFKNGKGMSFKGWPEGPHPYIENEGPVLIGAHLTRVGDTTLGDDAQNDCPVAFPQEYCQYRLRFFYTGGYTPNGISPIRPTDFKDHWRLVALNNLGQETLLEETNTPYTVGNGGLVQIVGLAELGARESPIVGCQALGSPQRPPRVDPVTGGCYDNCYQEDYDNYIDIILTGNDEGMKSIIRLEQPADGSGCYRDFYQSGEWEECVGYQPLFNPGGGGNVINEDPYFGSYVAGSAPGVSQNVVVDLENRMFVSYDRNAGHGGLMWQPIVHGSLLFIWFLIQK